MTGLPDEAAQGRQLGARLLGRRTRLLDFERRDEAGLLAPLRDLQGLELAGQVVVGDRQPRLGAAQRDVGERHLGGDRHLHVAQVRRAGPGAGFAGVERTAVGAEDVELPARVQAGREAAARGLPAGGPAPRRGRAAHRRPQRGGRDIAQRPRLAQRSLGALHAGVGLQGLDHQAAQQRVVEAHPPLRQRGRVRCRRERRRQTTRRAPRPRRVRPAAVSSSRSRTEPASGCPRRPAAHARGGLRGGQRER